MMSNVWKLVSNNSFFQIYKKKKNIYLPNNQTVDGFLVSIKFFFRNLCLDLFILLHAHRKWSSWQPTKERRPR